MRICPKCNEIVGNHAEKCFNCYADLVPEEDPKEEYSEDDYADQIARYSWRKHFFQFYFLNMLFVFAGSIILREVFPEIGEFLEKNPVLNLLYCAPVFSIFVVYMILGLFICPICGSLTTHRGAPLDITFHCCCRCGEKIQNHLAFSVRKALGLVIALVAALILLVLFSVLQVGLGRGICIFLSIAIFANLVVYIFLSCIWSTVFPD